ncbi:hypothetical protein FJ986_14485 [Mesorhizobium sp. B1-1-1]|nr:hypothetical protein FJ986_14485 [Mesorhizobium sp. B1-1-1]
MAPPKKRLLEEEALAVFLRELATADAIASSLIRDIEPPSEEDRAFGAEPLSKSAGSSARARACSLTLTLAHRLKRLQAAGATGSPTSPERPGISLA